MNQRLDALVSEKIVSARFGDAGAPDIGGYEASGGYRAIRKILGESSPKDVIEIVKASGLRGRGGGFCVISSTVEIGGTGGGRGREI